MSFILFFAWIAIHSLLLNIAVKAGWDHDPGYVGPAIIVLALNVTMALYASKSSNKS